MIPAELASLIDHQAIQTLTSRYCHDVWQRAGAVVADLFIPEGIYRSAPDRAPVVGRAELQRFFGELALRPARTFPYIHNHVIAIDGGRATGTCYLDSRSVVDGGFRMLGGHYADVYLKTAHGWLFESRHFNPDFDVIVPILV